jgi:putative membrane protein (TIGR04086 family)
MRWGRIIAGGLIAELMLFVVAVPVFSIGGQTMLDWVAVIGSAVTAFLAGRWVARRLESRFALHGALSGLTAALIYIALMVATGQTQPLIYWLAHLLKVAGGAAGAALGARRATAQPAARAGA